MDFKVCSVTSLGMPGISEGLHGKMSLLSWRKPMSALSYSEESVVPMRTVLPSELLGSMRTSLKPSADSNDPIDFFASGASSVTSFFYGGELSGGDDCCGMIVALDLALIGVLEGGADGDDPVGSRHLQLEVCVVGDGHELRVAWSS